MIVIKSPLNETSEAGTVIQTGSGFPLAYFGKGSYSGDIEINSSHASSQSETAQLIYIGRYSAIGTEIKIFCDVDHDFRSVYMGVISEYADMSENASFRDRWGMSTKRMKHRGMIIIGNDVWLGDNVTLVSDVTIGNGAVIGAGSVVAKDIPPYTIWCGNPAVCIGKRFSPETIEGLQKISWWDSDPSDLKAMEADMKGEADDLVAKYLPFATDLRKAPAPFEAQKDIVTMVAFVDTETPFPTYGDIIANFVEQYSDRSAELVLCYYINSERDLKVIDSLTGIQSSLEGIVNFRLLGITNKDDESVISHADCMVLGRDTRNIQRISYAFKYNVKLISGADSPMF